MPFSDGKSGTSRNRNEMELAARVLRESDLTGLLALSTAAGWNQNEADWRRMVALSGEFGLGMEWEGSVVASAMGVVYGPTLAWVGMVLTMPEWRGRGLATALLAKLLGALDRAGVEQIGLDATEMGAPIYARSGFVAVGGVERWGREGTATGKEELPELGARGLAWDRVAFGADRSGLLERLRDDGASAELADGSYVIVRPGRTAWQVGPMVATGAMEAERLARWAMGAAGGEALIWDLATANAESVRLAEGLGFRPRRQLVRMLRGEARGWKPVIEAQFALAGFEYA